MLIVLLLHVSHSDPMLCFLQAAIVTLGGLNEDLFVGLTWEDPISGIVPCAN